MRQINWAKLIAILCLLVGLLIAAIAFYDQQYQGECWGREGHWVRGHCTWDEAP